MDGPRKGSGKHKRLEMLNKTFACFLRHGLHIRLRQFTASDVPSFLLLLVESAVTKDCPTVMRLDHIAKEEGKMRRARQIKKGLESMDSFRLHIAATAAHMAENWTVAAQFRPTPAI